MITQILEIIGGMAGIIAIIIVIWDHFKDDRILAKKVQYLYAVIEMLIYTNYKAKIFRDLFRGDGFDQFPQTTKDFIAKSFYKTDKKNLFYQGLFSQRILKYSKYFGIVQHTSGEGYFMNEEILRCQMWEIWFNISFLKVKNVAMLNGALKKLT